MYKIVKSVRSNVFPKNVRETLTAMEVGSKFEIPRKDLTSTTMEQAQSNVCCIISNFCKKTYSRKLFSTHVNKTTNGILVTRTK